MTWQRIKDIWHAFRNNIVVKVLLCLYKCINFVLRIAILALILYSAAFTIAASIVLYKGFIYVYDLYDSVESLKDAQPEMSKYMEALRDSNPNVEIKHTFVPLDSISPYLQKAVIASEDAGFYFHPGFDVYAIAEALNANRISGKTKFGGSTITQQLAKNMFLSGERSWERKFKELAYALLMEHELGKDRILELYLNYAQWGKDIFGCYEACRTYYNCRHARKPRQASPEHARKPVHGETPRGHLPEHVPQEGQRARRFVAPTDGPRQHPH